MSEYYKNILEHDYDGNWRAMILDCINNEGFDYCFMAYSNFSEVTNKKFHKLRNNYIKVRNDLARYLIVENK